MYVTGAKLCMTFLSGEGYAVRMRLRYRLRKFSFIGVGVENRTTGTSIISLVSISNSLAVLILASFPMEETLDELSESSGDLV